MLLLDFFSIYQTDLLRNKLSFFLSPHSSTHPAHRIFLQTIISPVHITIVCHEIKIFCSFQKLSGQFIVHAIYCAVSLLSGQFIVRAVYCPHNLLSGQFIVRAIYCAVSLLSGQFIARAVYCPGSLLSGQFIFREL